MKIEIKDDTMTVTGLPELAEGQAASFLSEVSAALPARPGVIEVDLAQTTTMDCRGLGALVAVFDEARQRNQEAALRLVDPSPPVRQLLELTQLHRVFPVVHRLPMPGVPP